MSDSAYFAKELKSQTDKRILNYTALRVSHQGAHHFFYHSNRRRNLCSITESTMTSSDSTPDRPPGGEQLSLSLSLLRTSIQSRLY